jgi:hypothetical protein
MSVIHSNGGNMTTENLFTAEIAFALDADADTIREEMASKTAAELLNESPPPDEVRVCARRLIANEVDPLEVTVDGCHVVVVHGGDVEDRSPPACDAAQAAAVALLLRVCMVDELDRAVARVRSYIANVNAGRVALTEAAIGAAGQLLDAHLRQGVTL